MSTTTNNKRIAKNTLMLYFRQILTMLVSLYTVRVVLNALGYIDYGIYNVVGGIVVMFSFLSTTMSSASQRFFAYELGKNDLFKLKKTISVTVTIYAVIAIIILILAETIGLWFLNTKMVIPESRMMAANWIYQCTILSFMVTIMSTPYNALIIARENMNIFAYISILEVTLKLVIVYLLVLFSFDKLILYACLLLITNVIISVVYYIYCNNKYIESKYKFYWDKKMFNNLITYSGWNLFGSIAWIANNQGINILINLFFGPVVNTSRAIAYQVSSAINQFVSNFVTAVNPQITKYYAANEKSEMLNLVFRTSKYSFYLLFILSLPILLETNYILTLWLKNIPQYVVLFTRLVIITALIDSISSPLVTAALATGEIKKYQIAVGSFLLMNLPASYLLLKLGFQPQVTLYVAISISIICLYIRLIMLQKMIDLSVKRFFKKVLKPLVLVLFTASILPYIIATKFMEGLANFVIVGSIGLVCTAIAIYFIGLETNEKLLFKSILNSAYKKIRYFN